MSLFAPPIAFGSPIPHIPGKPCPFPEARGRVRFGDEWGQSQVQLKFWGCLWLDGTITAYRLPADHHAYGPRVSRMGRQPDRWVNAYPDGKNGMDHDDREIAILMGCPNSPGAPIGIWRIYLKENAA